MTMVTVFRSRLREGAQVAYDDVAADMSRLVRLMEGFIDEKIFFSEDGERVTIVRFRDAATQRAWAHHPDHLAAQQRGREEFYDWYDISVGDETYARTYLRSTSP